jgi:hypothetical protein
MYGESEREKDNEVLLRGKNRKKINSINWPNLRCLKSNLKKKSMTLFFYSFDFQQQYVIVQMGCFET